MAFSSRLSPSPQTSQYSAPTWLDEKYGVGELAQTEGDEEGAAAGSSSRRSRGCSAPPLSPEAPDALAARQRLVLEAVVRAGLMGASAAWWATESGGGESGLAASAQPSTPPPQRGAPPSTPSSSSSVSSCTMCEVKGAEEFAGGRNATAIVATAASAAVAASGDAAVAASGDAAAAASGDAAAASGDAAAAGAERNAHWCAPSSPRAAASAGTPAARSMRSRGTSAPAQAGHAHSAGTLASVEKPAQTPCDQAEQASHCTHKSSASTGPE